MSMRKNLTREQLEQVRDLMRQIHDITRAPGSLLISVSDTTGPSGDTPLVFITYGSKYPDEENSRAAYKKVENLKESIKVCIDSGVMCDGCFALHDLAHDPDADTIGTPPTDSKH